MPHHPRDFAVVVTRRSLLGEGAFWDHRQAQLYWVDILDGKVFAYDPGSGANREWTIGQFVGTLVPAVAGDLILALHHGLARLDIQTGRISPIADPEKGNPDIRFNDGKCDPAGRLWAGTMELTGKPDRGSLFCLDAKGTLTRKLPRVSISNGIAWSLNHEQMYYIDTGLNNVRTWDFDVNTGEIANERIAVRNENGGFFDGMTIDSEGMLWIAVFGAGQVRRYDPQDGRILQTIRLPVRQVTSCAFGGPKLDDLYITSASIGFKPTNWEKEPLSGSLFRVHPGHAGVPLPFYEG